MVEGREEKTLPGRTDPVIEVKRTAAFLTEQENNKTPSFLRPTATSRLKIDTFIRVGVFVLWTKEINYVYKENKKGRGVGRVGGQIPALHLFQKEEWDGSERPGDGVCYRPLLGGADIS